MTAECEDGTMLYSEQTIHHPPISHILVIGPHDLYRISGYYSFESKAGLNSLTILNSGKRRITFIDQSIDHNCPMELFSGTFIGTLRHESLGVLTFIDQAHEIKCEVKFASVYKKPSDYFTGSLTVKDREICSVSGTYLGYMDFGSERYWDARFIQPYPMTFKTVLPSDSELREDLTELRNNDVEQAQLAKETLEELQRSDRKLRAKMHPN